MDIFNELFGQFTAISSDTAVKVITAVALVLLFMLIGYLLKWVVVSILEYLKIGKAMSRVGLDKVFDVKVAWNELIGDLIQWAFIIVGLLQALELFEGTRAVSEFFGNILGYLPNVLAAVFIVLISAIVADLLARLVENTARTIGASTAAFLADVSKYAVIIFGFIAALEQLKIGTAFLSSFVNNFFLMVAIAAGLAFGLGGQDAAKDAISRVKHNWPKNRHK